MLYLNSSFHKTLDLSWCFIQDHGLGLLHHGLATGINASIKIMDLRYNNLIKSSSSLVSDLVIHFGVEILMNSYNYTNGENHALYDMLFNPSSKLVKLHMQNTRLSSKAANVLFFTIQWKRNCSIWTSVSMKSLVMLLLLLWSTLLWFNLGWTTTGSVQIIVKCIVTAVHLNDTL